MNSSCVAAGSAGGLAEVLDRCRIEAAACLLEAVRGWDAYAPLYAQLPDPALVAERDFGFMIDYLRLWIGSGSTVYRDLLVGEKVRQCSIDTDTGIDAQFARRRALLEAECSGLIRCLGDRLGSAQREQLHASYLELQNLLTTRARHALTVLLVGDCLYLDVTAFLVGALLEDGISMETVLVHQHQPVLMRNDLRRLQGRRFDAVFYSPFSYEFSSEYSSLQWWHRGAASHASIRAIAQRATSEAMVTVDLVRHLFDCPIFVHDSVQIRRHDGSLREWIKNLLSARARSLGRAEVNTILRAQIGDRRQQGATGINLVPESGLLALHTGNALGRLFYDHDSRHPAALGRHVADLYRDRLYVLARLARKKLLVCDLDNTLWHGVIGEGAVRHDRERQSVVHRLKQRGVVLAIASKNDPAKVRWDGALLGPDDFVSAQISWNGKTESIRRIAAHLNLKPKDFVFIDDRADEREMVQLAFDGIEVLDATQTRSWHLLDLWAQSLDGDEATDRTRMYREKDARDAFLGSTPVEKEDPAAVYAALELRVGLRLAGERDLKRMVELVNRTNQFNTRVSRTQAGEAAAWIGSARHVPILVDCSDKFGDMGMISVCLAQIGTDAIDIPVFVLSCRVFGYDIEIAAVNAIKRVACRLGLPIVARVDVSAHNGPCQDVYERCGFERHEGQWRWQAPRAPEDPSWLHVESDAALSARWAGA